MRHKVDQIINQILCSLLSTRIRIPPTALMYHSIGKPIKCWPWRISEVEFISQLDWLHKNNIQVCSMAEHLASKSEKAINKVVMTFDDGFRDNLATARLLQQRGMTASFYIVSSEVGGYAHWENSSSQLPLLAAKEVEQLHAMGMEVGAHGWQHQRMNKIAFSQLTEELQRCKLSLERLIGVPVSGLAYPYGSFDQHVISAAKAANFSYAFTTQSGRLSSSDNEYMLKRLTIYSYDQLDAFINKLLIGSNSATWTQLWSYLISRLQQRILR